MGWFGMGLLALVACGQERPGGTAVGNPGITYARLAPPADPLQAGPYVGWTRADAGSLTVTAVPCDGEPMTETLINVSLLDGPELPVPAGALCALEVELEQLFAEGDGAFGWETLELPTASVSLRLDGRAVDGGTWIVELGEPGAADQIAERSAVFDDVGADGLLSPLERSREPLASAPGREADVVPVLLVVGDDGSRLVVGVGEAMPVLAQSKGPGGYDVAAGGGDAWVAAGGDGISLSTDLGLSWSELAPLPAVSALSPSDAGDFWAVGGGTWWSIGRPGVEELSSEAVAWHGVTSSPYGPVRVGAGVIDVDGRRTNAPGGTLRAVGEHDGQLVAVGDGGARWVSDDGRDWVDVSEAAGPDLAHVVHTGRAWVAVSVLEQEVVQGSVDGTSWSDVANKGLSDVVAVDGVLFGTVETGLQRSDDDGATWVFAANFFPGGGVALTAIARQ